MIIREIERKSANSIYGLWSFYSLLLCQIYKKIFQDILYPYQYLEERYELTKRILEILSEYLYPIIIFTKSYLVLRENIYEKK
jgi:hypothetical protein